MPKGYPKDGRPPGRPENFANVRKKFAQNDERTKKAGAKGNETQRALREFKDLLTEQLKAPVKGSDGKPQLNPDGSAKTVQDKLARALVTYASAGDMTAYALMLKMLGQYPEERSRVTLEEAVPQIVDDIPLAPPPAPAPRPEPAPEEKPARKRTRRAGGAAK